ncbi:hypothetical protein [Lentzea sp. E54]|uniref:hypothetical protein n=1 Tax=Lentzea xerophila TaxID=3435883 RepID=UPI003DA38A65
MTKIHARVLAITAGAMFALGLGSVLGTSSALASPEESFGDDYGYYSKYEAPSSHEVYASDEDFLREPENNDHKPEYKPEYATAASPATKAEHESARPDEHVAEVRQEPAKSRPQGGCLHGLVATSFADPDSLDGDGSGEIKTICIPMYRF